MVNEMIGEQTTCPKCGSLAAALSYGPMTAMAIFEFTDKEGKHHYHDPNHGVEIRVCLDCNETYYRTMSFRCWCGYPDVR